MTGDEVQRLLDGVFDQALVHHGFTEYVRDYELVAYCTSDPRTGIGPHHLRYLFETCVHATAETAVSEEVWTRSLDDRLIDYQTGVDLDGYVWGVNRSRRTRLQVPLGMKLRARLCAQGRAPANRRSNDRSCSPLCPTRTPR